MGYCNNVLKLKTKEEYLATLNKKIDKDFIQKMRGGVRIRVSSQKMLC